MKAADIMTTPVVTVTPDTRVHVLAALLWARRISAVPVVENGRLAGIVSEADLLHRAEIGTDADARLDSWWRHLVRPEDVPSHYVRTHAMRVADIMTRDVATVGPQATLAEVAEVLEKRRVKRVPVLEAGRLVGIVSRSDLVHALAETDERPPAPRDDEALRARLLDELERQPWWRTGLSNVSVADGVVTYEGVIGSEAERAAARVAAERIPGVRRVVDRRYEYRDLPSMV